MVSYNVALWAQVCCKRADLNHSFHMASCTTVPLVMNKNATRGMAGPRSAHLSCAEQRDRSVVLHAPNSQKVCAVLYLGLQRLAKQSDRPSHGDLLT